MRLSEYLRQFARVLVKTADFSANMANLQQGKAPGSASAGGLSQSQGSQGSQGFGGSGYGQGRTPSPSPVGPLPQAAPLSNEQQEEYFGMTGQPPPLYQRQHYDWRQGTPSWTPQSWVGQAESTVGPYRNVAGMAAALPLAANAAYGGARRLATRAGMNVGGIGAVGRGLSRASGAAVPFLHPAMFMDYNIDQLGSAQNTATVAGNRLFSGAASAANRPAWLGRAAGAMSKIPGAGMASKAFAGGGVPLWLAIDALKEGVGGYNRGMDLNPDLRWNSDRGMGRNAWNMARATGIGFDRNNQDAFRYLNQTDPEKGFWGNYAADVGQTLGNAFGRPVQTAYAPIRDSAIIARRLVARDNDAVKLQAGADRINSNFAAAPADNSSFGNLYQRRMVDQSGTLERLPDHRVRYTGPAGQNQRLDDLATWARLAAQNQSVRGYFSPQLTDAELKQITAGGYGHVGDAQSGETAPKLLLQAQREGVPANDPAALRAWLQQRAR